MADQSIDPRLREIAAASSFQTPPRHLQAPPARSPTTQYQSPQDQQYRPHTPGTDEHGEGTDGGASDPKRPRACEACRGLKVRCEPDPNNQDAPCKRCAKANRQCVITQPSRKRQKKTDSRVAELENKINHLTAFIHAQNAQKSPDQAIPGPPQQDTSSSSTQPRGNAYQQVTNGGYASVYAQPTEAPPEAWPSYPKTSEPERSKASVPPMVVAGQKRKHGEGREYSTANGSPAPSAVAGASLYLDTGVSEPPPHDYADVIDRGVVTAEMANTMFDWYVEKMSPHLGAVVFPPGTKAADIRKHKPTLFLAILSSSSGSLYPRLQKPLTKELMSIFGERIISNGEKTLELIQALHVSTLWYFPPEHFEELKFYQLIHMAAVMAIDIGMGKKSKASRPKPAAGLWRDHPWRRTPFPDPESIEARRSWLACYFLCANASMGLRRPNLIRWSPFIGECVDALQSSPDALPSDRSLCQWVCCQRIAEEVGTQFSMDDPSAVVSITDPKVQYALKGFERDLHKWSEQLSSETATPALKVMEHVVNLYMHEVALHVDHNVEEFKPPFTEDGLRAREEGDPKPLTSGHVSALSICLTSIDGIFEIFLGLDIEMIRCLPVANFVRIAYAVVVLIKMYFAAALPNSELGKVIDKDNMKVERWLDGVVEKFKAAAAEERSRSSAKFVMVLLMLKTWFNRQRDSKVQNTEKPAAATEPLPDISRQRSTNLSREDHQGAFGAENTPLQLLSEVATGNSREQNRRESASKYTSSNNWQEQQASYPNYGPSTQYSMNQNYGNVNAGGHNVDPNLGGLDLGYSMGDNLEQAMGMTLGAGDFGSYFTDDSFFGGMVDGVPIFDGM